MEEGTGPLLHGPAGGGGWVPDPRIGPGCGAASGCGARAAPHDRALHGLVRRSRRQPEAELGVILAGSDEFVGMDLDPGGDTGEHFRSDRTRVLDSWAGPFSHQPLAPIDLLT